MKRGRRMRLYGKSEPPLFANIRKCPRCRARRNITSFVLPGDGPVARSQCKMCNARKRAGFVKWWATRDKKRYVYAPESPEVLAARRERGRERWEKVKKYGVCVLREEGLLK